MDIQEYFENTTGTGVLATSDADGTVDIALYAKPHVIDKRTIAFIMAHRLSYQNIQLNPKAAYLFLELKLNGESGNKGIRLYLSKSREENDKELIDKLRRKPRGKDNRESTIVFFTIDTIRPLIGD